MRQLPPLNSLRAFEAAARHLNFSRAAKELNVSQGAISHHVKMLEQNLGVELFLRTGRTPTLTHWGETFVPTVTQALDGISAAAAAIRGRHHTNRLSVLSLPMFASKWLIPRLGLFLGDHPDVEFRFQHSLEAISALDFRRGDVDIAIHWDIRIWPEAHSEVLMPSPLMPICSPRLTDGGRPLNTLDDLDHHVLLHLTDYGMWERWLESADATHIESKRDIVLYDYNVLIESAVSGQGVGLGVISLLDEYFADGRLIMPLDVPAYTDLTYRLIYARESLERPAVRAFRDWILEEVREQLPK